MDPEEIRQDFPIFQEKENLVYLDNAATTQKPEQVIKTIEKFYRKNNSNIGRGLYDLAEEATQAYRESRKTVADFINAESDEVVFVRNTTEAENLLASSLDFEGEILISRMAHHSEQLPWRRKAQEDGNSLDFLETREGKISLESAREKISENTGIIAISHISNVFGAENPVEEIIELAHEKDALVVLDAAQSVPHRPLDVKELKADFVAFSGHKMLGPSGTGVLYGKKHLLDKMAPYQVGGGMIKSVKKKSVKYEDPPEKFEAGTPNIAGAVGLGAAIDYLDSFDMEEVEEHDKALSAKMIEGLEKIKGVNVLSPQGSSLVSFTTEYAHPHDVAEVLNQHGVAVRAGHHCAQPQMEELGINGTARASPYIYNTEQDVENFLEAVKEIKEMFS